MVAYAFFMTLLVGIFIGIIGTVTTAIKMEERAVRKLTKMHVEAEQKSVAPEVLAKD